MAYQLLCALEFFALPDVDIIHCDLKPENILLKKPHQSAIKIIDFGNSCHSQEQVYTYIQSRFYRAPEILLGLDNSQAIDMWSVGCILMELHTGRPLFPGQDACDLMRHFIEFNGLPPPSMTDRSCWTDQYFEKQANGEMILRSHPDVTQLPRTGLRERIERSKNTKRWVNNPGHSEEHYDRFIDLVQKMLVYDPRQRITPEEALNHPFFTSEEHLCDGLCVRAASGCPGAKRLRPGGCGLESMATPKKMRRYHA